MLRSILKTATFRQSQITIAGTLINGVLGVLFYVFMARFLGPADFGFLAVSIATLTLIADIADLGTNTGLIRFVSSNINSDKTKALKFLKLGLLIKFVTWLVILVLGFFLAPTLASLVFKKNELILPLRLVMIGVGGALLFTFVTSSLQAFQKYFIWGFVNICSNFLRLAFVFLLFFNQQLNLISGLVTYIALPFLGFSLGILFLPVKQILASKKEFEVAQDFFKFNKWVALFTIIAAVSSRMDTFLSARLLSANDIGIYASASQLTQVIPQIVGALGVVAAPKFASFQSKAEMLKYFKKFQLMVLGLGLLIALAIPLSFYFLPLLYGVDYSSAVLPFTILLFSMIIFLLSMPLHNSIIFYFGRSDIFVWVSIIHLFVISVVGFYMITNYGVIGAALTVLIGMVVNFILPFVWFLLRLRK